MLIIDDGADMIMVLHNERTDVLKHIKRAYEKTTTIINFTDWKLSHKDGALKFPVVAVNDAYTKYLFDNRYGTGQSSFDAIMGTTNMLAKLVICCCMWIWMVLGRGIAPRAQGLGANVIVTEIDQSEHLKQEWMIAQSNT